MTNNTPPRACLADFGFMTVVLGPGQELPRAKVEGGMMAFIAPELLMPERFGKEGSTPTPHADIYAFGMVIFQVCERDRGYQPLLHTVPPGPYR